MKKLKLRIDEWDGTSLLISCTSDDKDFDNCSCAAYQPAFYQSSDIESLLKEIARSSISLLEDLEKKEQFKESESLIDEISKTVGNVYEWDISDLVNQDVIKSLSPEEYSELNVVEKLELAGIKIDELKEALGLL